MNTSYFAKYRGSNGVNIAIKHPPGFPGTSYPALFPKYWFFKRYKEDGDEVAYTEAYYSEVLNRLDPQKVYNDLKGSTILCWEKSGSFCHRRIVAKWLSDNLGVKVPEL